MNLKAILMRSCSAFTLIKANEGIVAMMKYEYLKAKNAVLKQ